MSRNIHNNKNKNNIMFIIISCNCIKWDNSHCRNNHKIILCNHKKMTHFHSINRNEYFYFYFLPVPWVKGRLNALLYPQNFDSSQCFKKWSNDRWHHHLLLQNWIFKFKLFFFGDQLSLKNMGCHSKFVYKMGAMRESGDL